MFAGSLAFLALAGAVAAATASASSELRGTAATHALLNLWGQRNRSLQEASALGNDGWQQVQTAIQAGHCAKNYPLSAVKTDSKNSPQKFVEAHNYYRACHGSPPVTWDDQLAAYAKQWVEVLLQHCDGVMDVQAFIQASGHEPHDPFSYTTETPQNAENLAMFQNVIVPVLPFDETAPVEGWYREVDNQCPNKGMAEGCGGGTLNHFTAMIWKSVTRIGCHSAIRGGFKMVSCRYTPANPGSVPCDLPNTGGCDVPNGVNGAPEAMVPALVGGHCEPIPGMNAGDGIQPFGSSGPTIVPFYTLAWRWFQGVIHKDAPPPVPQAAAGPSQLFQIGQAWRPGNTIDSPAFVAVLLAVAMATTAVGVAACRCRAASSAHQRASENNGEDFEASGAVDRLLRVEPSCTTPSGGLELDELHSF